jgi:hypothetical protein
LVDEAVRLMPGSLRLALETHREDLLRGMLGPMVDEDGPQHRPPWDQGTLDRRVEAEIAALLAAMESATSFREIAGHFGAIAHFVADAGFPPAVSRRGGDGRYTHFSKFCESRREKFPVVFYGHRDELLELGDFTAFTVAVMERAAAEDIELARAYARAGDPPDPAAFDDRSVPFAVASLSYSRTFTDIVNVWLAAWNRGGGDMDAIPYHDPDATNEPLTPGGN